MMKKVKPKYSELLKKSRKHYLAMIKFAREQNPRGEVNAFSMIDSISQYWFYDDCAYCEEFFNDCDICPLQDEKCCGGLWIKMAESRTWNTFANRAEKVLEYIETHG